MESNNYYKKNYLNGRFPVYKRQEIIFSHRYYFPIEMIIMVQLLYISSQETEIILN